MIYNLLQNKKKISRLGLGTAQFGMNYGYTKIKSQCEVNDILSACLEYGINFLDTARGYGDSECKIGNFIKSVPENSFVVGTKLARISEADNENPRQLKEQIFRSISDSIENLNVNNIDLLQV